MPPACPASTPAVRKRGFEGVTAGRHQSNQRASEKEGARVLCVPTLCRPPSTHTCGRARGRLPGRGRCHLAGGRGKKWRGGVRHQKKKREKIMVLLSHEGWLCIVSLYPPARPTPRHPRGGLFFRGFAIHGLTPPPRLNPAPGARGVSVAVFQAPSRRPPPHPAPPRPDGDVEDFNWVRVTAGAP